MVMYKKDIDVYGDRRIHHLTNSLIKNPKEDDGLEQYRRLFCWALIGANRTGKTSTILGMISDWKKANPRKKVIAFDPQSFLKQAKLVDTDIPAKMQNDWAKELMTKNGKQYEGMGGAVEYKYGDSLLILDDFRKLHPWHQLQLDFLALLGERTKMNLDIIYCVWSPINLLDQLAGFTNRYSIFYHMAQQGGFSDKIPNSIPCRKCALLINKYATTYNILDRGKELYPDKFPYFLIRDDYETRVTAVNIDEQLLKKIL